MYASLHSSGSKHQVQSGEQFLNWFSLLFSRSHPPQVPLSRWDPNKSCNMFFCVLTGKSNRKGDITKQNIKVKFYPFLVNNKLVRRCRCNVYSQYHRWLFLLTSSTLRFLKVFDADKAIHWFSIRQLCFRLEYKKLTRHQVISCLPNFHRIFEFFQFENFWIKLKSYKLYFYDLCSPIFVGTKISTFVKYWTSEYANNRHS